MIINNSFEMGNYLIIIISLSDGAKVPFSKALRTSLFLGLYNQG